jgi:ribonuclease HII
MRTHKTILPSIEAEANAGRDDTAAYAFLKDRLKNDPRMGAQKLLSKYERRASGAVHEIARLQKMWVYESQARERGARVLAGVDEAGRGPLAGPVVAAAVILPEQPDLGFLSGLNDSKLMTAEKRELLFSRIYEIAVSVGVGFAQAKEIDEINILQASRRAMERGVMKLTPQPDWLLLDAITIEGFPFDHQQPIIHGDALSLSIAAASVVAKVTRDHLMLELDEKYPGYGFAKHKGYGTAAHLSALRKLGPCPEHRGTFSPVQQLTLGGF